MSNKETSLSPTTRGLFTFGKPRAKTFAQYFQPFVDQNDLTIGFVGQYDDYFQRIRHDKITQKRSLTKQYLLRAELLTKTNTMIPRNGKSQERLKYEQDIVRWMEDSIARLCGSCSKPFGIFGRKHHCRLDGSVICSDCSRFVSFSIANWLVKLNSTPNKLDEVDRLRLNNLLNVTSTMIIDDGTHEEYLRICKHCGKVLQQFYDQNRFRNIQKDQAILQYDKIVEIQHNCLQNQSIYLIILNSLLNAETVYEMNDALRLYQQLNSNYNKINSIAVIIAKLGETTKTDDKRYNAFCRNIKTHVLFMLQNYSKTTKPVPSKDEIQQIRREREAKTIVVNSPSSPLTRQSSNSQRIQFVRQRESVETNEDAIFIDLS